MMKLSQTNWFIIDFNAFLQFDASYLLNLPHIKFLYNYNHRKNQLVGNYLPVWLLLEYSTVDEKVYIVTGT